MNTSLNINHIRTVAIVEGHDAVAVLCNDYESLRTINADMLEALEHIVRRKDEHPLDDDSAILYSVRKIARAAIAKAKGQGVPS